MQRLLNAAFTRSKKAMAAAGCKKIDFTGIKLYLDRKLKIFSTFLQIRLQALEKLLGKVQTGFSVGPQPDDDDDGDDDEDDEDEGEGPSSEKRDEDVPSRSLSFLLPVQTDLWAGLNCHVTFLEVEV